MKKIMSYRARDSPPATKNEPYKDILSTELAVLSDIIIIFALLSLIMIIEQM